MTQSQPICPACGSTEVLFSTKRQDYVCEDCGHRWSSTAPTPSLDWPPGLDPNVLPTYLAAPLASLLAELHPRLRLHGLVDCSEIALRWSVAVAMAEVLHDNDGTLPESLIERIRDQIERPTLGKWIGMLEAISATRPVHPLLVPGVFDLYRTAIAPRFRSEGEGATVENSLLVLRNHLAHGTGLRTEAARALLQAHEEGVFDLLRAVADATANTTVIAIDNGQAQRLAGPHPNPMDCPEELRGVPDGPWLIGERGALPLLPLMDYRPVYRVGSAGRPEERPGGPAAQLYLRADRDRVTYVPLDRDEAVSQVFDVKSFRDLFRLDNAQETQRSPGEGFHWQDFLREARVLQEELVGRVNELTVLKGWLKGRETRQPGVSALGIVFGGPGLGKSLLMARVAADLANSKPEQQGIYYHRFRAGDARNNTRAFLSGLNAALADWPPLHVTSSEDTEQADTDQKLMEVVRNSLAAVAELPPPHPAAPPPRFLVLVDGLDEALPHDPNLPMRLRELALPGTIWLVASRPESAVQRAFSGPGCESVFPHGLPPMSETDMRAMLEEGLANSRHALIARDQDTTEGGVFNPFVARVVACADGLPLYVHLLLEDLRNGRLSVHDENRLPEGLVAYYDELMNRTGLSDLKRDLPLLVALLARAEEPLDDDALALLLADVPEDAPRYAERVQATRRAGQALLRNAPTPDGTEGLTLYHQSFRDYVGGRLASDDRPAIPPAPALAGTVRDAETKLCRLAKAWTDLPRGTLRNHLFRWGVRYALRWQGTAGRGDARRRLTDFDFLQAFMTALPSSAIRNLVNDYETLLTRLPDGAERQEFRFWEAFIREREHILRRGDEDWPSHKILLQLAVEHADDSPVTREAEAWLEQGKCDWIWLRNPKRGAHAVWDPCLRVFEGHTDNVNGAQALPDGRILSWSWDSTLRLWDGQTGAPLATLAGHTDSIEGAQALPDGRILSWSADKTLRLWDGQTGTPLAKLVGHTDRIDGAQALPDGRILSWSADRTLRLWDGQTGAPLTTLAGHTKGIDGTQVLPDGRILSWSADRTLLLWDGQTSAPLTTLAGHTSSILGAHALPDGRILSWSWDNNLRLWDGQTGASLATLAGHTDIIEGAHVLPDGRILSWSWDRTLRLWDGQTGAPLAKLVGHSNAIYGAQVLSDGRILSWSADKTLRLWDGQTGAPLAKLVGHTDRIDGAQALPDGHILSWCCYDSDKTLRLWDGQTGAPLATLAGHAHGIRGAQALPDGRILSWSADSTLRLWDGQTGAPLATLAGHKSMIINGAQALPDGRILSWSEDRTLLLWNGESGRLLATLAGHTDNVNGAQALPDGRILSWSWDSTLRLWDGQTGTPLATLAGHTGSIEGAHVLPDGRILSWSWDRTLRLWDGQTGAPLAKLVGHSNAIYGAQVLSDGRILSWSADKTLRLWDGQTGTPLATLAGHTERIVGAQALPDGRILSWSSERTLRLWDRQTGAPLATLAGHTDSIEGAQALPDGRILSWSADRTLLLWNGESGRLLGKPTRKECLAWQSLSLVLRQREAGSPGCFSGLFAAGSSANTGYITHCAGQTPRTCWQGNGDVEALALHADGIMVVILGRSRILCLQLYRGARRITLAKYENFSPSDLTRF